MSKVVLLGAGPGEFDLLTLKGKKILEKADCIIYDRLLNPRMLSLAPGSCEKIFVGKMNHKHTMPQDKINELLVTKANEYDLVVRLKGGDPYVFGRGGEEALYLKERGIKVEIVPGISSSIAALAAAGIPITHRGLAKGFQVITAHSKKDECADIDYTSLLDETVTLVFLMGLAHVGEIARGLILAGRKESTKAAVISSGTTNHQIKVCGTLSDIEKKVLASDISSPAIIVVGDVVQLSSELDFFEKRPLFGKKYFLPTIRHFNYSLEKGEKKDSNNELLDKLIENGAEVVTVETGEISPIVCEMDWLNNSQNAIITFTSANGVNSFFWNLEQINKDVRVLSNFKFATIGQKTSDALKKFGINSDITSSRQTGVDLAQKIHAVAAEKTDIIWFTTKHSSDGFKENLRKDLNLKKNICYENSPSNIIVDEKLITSIKNCDGAIFTSGSNATATIPLLKEHMPDNVYSIGPSCSKVINELGIKNIKEAAISSYLGIMELLL